MSQYHLAQLNIADLKFPLDSPELKDFVDNLDRINALAESSPGFVWRLQTDEGDATAIDFFGENRIVNMSVWESVEHLHQYVYRSAHIEVMRRKKEWFERIAEAHMVLWWIEAGTTPSLEQAEAKLNALHRNGPSQDAFTFKKAWPPPGSRVRTESRSLDPEGCTS